MKTFSKLFSVSPKKKRKAGNIKMKLKMFLKKTKAKTKQIKIKGQKFDLNLISDVRGNRYDMTQALKDVKIIERNYDKYLKQLITDMYDEFYKNWKTPDKDITRKQWIDGLKPIAVNFYVGGSAEISWADDLIFDGHILSIELKPKTFEGYPFVSMNG